VEEFCSVRVDEDSTGGVGGKHLNWYTFIIPDQPFATYITTNINLFFSSSLSSSFLPPLSLPHTCIKGKDDLFTHPFSTSGDSNSHFEPMSGPAWAKRVSNFGWFICALKVPMCDKGGCCDRYCGGRVMVVE
jgi:hypothetical protein